MKSENNSVDNDSPSNLERWGIVFVILLILIYTMGCSSGTVSPNPVIDNIASYDSTTPDEYDGLNSGVIGLAKNEDGVVFGRIITNDARNRYNYLISVYGIQFKEAFGASLSKDDGIAPYKDIDLNALWTIKNEFYVYFITMHKWLKSGREKDGVWERLKNL